MGRAVSGASGEGCSLTCPSLSHPFPFPKQHKTAALSKCLIVLETKTPNSSCLRHHFDLQALWRAGRAAPSSLREPSAPWIEVPLQYHIFTQGFSCVCHPGLSYHRTPRPIVAGCFSSSLNKFRICNFKLLGLRSSTCFSGNIAQCKIVSCTNGPTQFL